MIVVVLRMNVMTLHSNTLHKVKDDDPRLQNHPMLTEELNWRERVVPLIIHGDGVRFTMKGNSLLTLQWVFLIASAWGWGGDLLYFRVHKSVQGFSKAAWNWERHVESAMGLYFVGFSSVVRR